MLEILEIGRDHHPAFARRHQLAFLEAEASEVANGARALPAILAAVRVRAILDQL